MKKPLPPFRFNPSFDRSILDSQILDQPIRQPKRRKAGQKPKKNVRMPEIPKLKS